MKKIALLLLCALLIFTLASCTKSDPAILQDNAAPSEQSVPEPGINGRLPFRLA